MKQIILMSFFVFLFAITTINAVEKFKFVKDEQSIKVESGINNPIEVTYIDLLILASVPVL